MQPKEFPESDWQLFSSKVGVWQEGYIDKLNKEYVEILNENTEPSEKFWKLDERLRQDKKKSGVQLNMSRSKLLIDILSLIDDGVIRIDDLEEFSEELKNAVRYFFGTVV